MGGVKNCKIKDCEINGEVKGEVKSCECEANGEAINCEVQSCGN
jgi:hypothetical protein